MMSRNERPRLRYFLAIETTSRRFPQLGLVIVAVAISQPIPIIAISIQHVAHGAKVERDALPDRALIGLVLGGADFHRAIERQIAVIDLLQDFDRALKAIVRFQDLG